jgi:hypothetical protein
MAITHSKYVLGALRVPAAQDAGDVVAVRYEFTYDNTTSDGDILELGILPAYHTVRDMVLTATDVDSGTDFEWDIGLMNGGVDSPGGVGEDTSDGSTARTCGDEFFDGATVGQTAGSARMSEADGFNVAPVAYDRSIGVKFVDQGTTTGTFSVTVIYGT